MVPPEEMAYGISFMMLGESSFKPPMRLFRPSCANVAPLIEAQLSGIGIGLSIAGAVFVNTSLNGLSQLLPQLSRVDLQLLIAGTSNKFFETLTPEQRSDTIDIIVSGLSRTFILVYVAGAFSLVASLLFTVREPCPVSWSTSTNYVSQKRKMFAGATAIVG